MPQHVGVWLQLTEASSFTSPLYHAIEPRRCHRRPALRYEYKAAVRVLFAKLTQGPHLITTDGMDCIGAALGPFNAQIRCIEINLRPLQVDSLGSPQGMTI